MSPTIISGLSERLSKPKAAIVGKSSQQIALEKQLPDLTFKPDLTLSKSVSAHLLQKRKPILYLDVNLGDIVKRLVIKQHDSIEQKVKHFCTQYQLSQQKEQILLQLI